MHSANIKWWTRVARLYPGLFRQRRVLEVGSRWLNGSVRDFFKGCDYTGLDWRAGPCVDVVSLAHEMAFDQPFDVIISASMLEHDPYWSKSLTAMVAHLNTHGALLLSWGSAENQPHDHASAPDGQFHPLPAGRVLQALEVLGLYVEQFVYEANIDKRGGWGECGLVAFQDQSDGLGATRISRLRKADRL